MSTAKAVGLPRARTWHELPRADRRHQLGEVSRHRLLPLTLGEPRPRAGYDQSRTGQRVVLTQEQMAAKSRVVHASRTVAARGPNPRAGRTAAPSPARRRRGLSRRPPRGRRAALRARAWRGTVTPHRLRASASSGTAACVLVGYQTLSVGPTSGQTRSRCPAPGSPPRFSVAPQPVNPGLETFTMTDPSHKGVEP